MARRTRDYVLIVLSIGFVSLTTSLGFWQLRRLAQRRAQNAEVVSRLAHPAIPVRQLTHDTAALHYRRVILKGRYDYSRQIKIADRTRNGSPGVNILTPLLRTGRETAVLVNRGWVYSPDGTTIDTKPWREADTLNGHGVIETFPTQGPFPPPNPDRPRTFRRLDRAALTKAFSYPIANYYIVLTDSATSPSAPPRVEQAPIDEGPHRNYAIQWFSFAAISIIGLGIFLRRT